MVYCTSCGKENEEGVKFCINCGASLAAEKEKKDECFGPERHEDECFGLPHAGAIVGIVFGLLIIISGVSLLLGVEIWEFIWPYVIIIIGLLVVAGAIYGLTRKSRH